MRNKKRKQGEVYGREGGHVLECRASFRRRACGICKKGMRADERRECRAKERSLGKPRGSRRDETKIEWLIQCPSAQRKRGRN